MVYMEGLCILTAWNTCWLHLSLWELLIQGDVMVLSDVDVFD